MEQEREARNEAKEIGEEKMIILFALFIGMPSDSYNLQCGITPITPIGCETAICVCDEDGDNCKWEFIC